MLCAVINHWFKFPRYLLLLIKKQLDVFNPEFFHFLYARQSAKFPTSMDKGDLTVPYTDNIYCTCASFKKSMIATDCGFYSVLSVSYPFPFSLPPRQCLATSQQT